MPQQTEQTYTRNQIADMLGASVSTVRKYERQFGKWLQHEGGERGQGKPNEYSQEDYRVLATVHHLRQRDISYDDIAAGALDEALEGGTFEPEPPRQEPGEGAERGDLVPAQQYALVLGQFRATEQTLQRTLDELDEVRERLLDAERRAAAGDEVKSERDRLLARVERLEALLEGRPAPATPETVETDEDEALKQRLDELERQLDEERAKTWWQKLRGR